MTVLCATDFSPCSVAATELAASMARRLGEKLFLLHVVEPLVLPPEAPPGSEAWTRGMMEAANGSIERAAEPLVRGGLAVETRVLLGGAAGLILETARERAARFVVIGTHGRKGPARFFLGSVAEHVARHASCPVVVTREDVPAGGWLDQGSLRLAVAMDGSFASGAALTWLANLSRVVECDVTLIRLYWPPEEAARYGIDEPWLGSEGSPRLVRLLERDLVKELRLLCPDRAPRLRFRAAARDAADALVAEAASLQPDAIVLGVPHGPQHRAALSTAAVLRTAPAPVICIPEGVVTSAKPIPEMRSMLVATDLSEGSRELIRRAYGPLRAGGGRVELLHVHLGEGPASSPLGAVERAALETELRALVPADARTLGVETNISVVEARTAADGILQAAERLGVDLIAVGSHARLGIKRAVLGSVAEAVARHADRPVVILRDCATQHE
jgi:nucleotide-binding universal stress UspA family protein